MEEGGKQIYSKKIRAGKKTYFFDVQYSKSYYVKISECVKNSAMQRGISENKKFTIFVYPEDFNKFSDALLEVITHVKTKLMPEFDYNKFSHNHDVIQEKK